MYKYLNLLVEKEETSPNVIKGVGYQDILMNTVPVFWYLAKNDGIVFRVLLINTHK